ncbi:MAG: PAS domain S-box protein, partial [Verrucomicrobiota bacterium]
MNVQGQAVQQCVFRDITARKRAEDEITRQAALIRSLLDSIPDIVFFKDTEGVYLGCNPAFAEVVGRPRNEIVGKTDHDLVAKASADFFREQDRQMLAERKPRHNEEFITYPDGRRVLLDTLKTPYWGPDGELIGVLGIGRDVTTQQQAELKLSQERQRLASIIQGTRAGTWELNVQTGEAIINELWALIVGYTLEELAPISLKTWETLVHPDDQEMARATLERHLSGTLDFYECEVRMRHKDGRWVWIHSRGQIVIRSAGGQPLMVYGTSVDITERKQVEIQLRRMTERQVLAARAGGVGIWDYDVANNRLVWDDQMFELYGITRDRFCGAYEAWQAGLHPEDRQRGDEEIRLALRGEKEFNTEFRVLWPDGTTRTIRALATVQRDASGQPTHMVGTNWDITAQQQADEALIESETCLRAITDSAQDAILMLNPEGGISFWNPAAERIFGYTSAEALGQNLQAIFAPPGYHEVHQAALPEFWQNEQGPAVGKTTDLEGRRKDGQEI